MQIATSKKIYYTKFRPNNDAKIFESNLAANYLPICLQLKRLLIESHSNLDFSQVIAALSTHLPLSLTGH